MFRFKFFSSLALLAAALLPAAWAQEAWQGRVQYVVDGDSIWVRPLEGGQRVRLRLRGIDAPEMCQTGGPQARAALQALAQGQLVWVQVRARDRYGRAVADVQRSRDGLNLAQHMVASGWAWSDGRGRGAYPKQQAAARAGGLGVFAQGQPEQPAQFRRRMGHCPKGVLGADVR